MTILSLDRGNLESMSPILADMLVFPPAFLYLSPRLSPVGDFLTGDALGSAAGLANNATTPPSVCLSSRRIVRPSPSLSLRGTRQSSGLAQHAADFPVPRTKGAREYHLHNPIAYSVSDSAGSHTCDRAPAKDRMRMVHMDFRPPSPGFAKYTEHPRAAKRSGA